VESDSSPGSYPFGSSAWAWAVPSSERLPASSRPGPLPIRGAPRRAAPEGEPAAPDRATRGGLLLPGRLDPSQCLFHPVDLLGIGTVVEVNRGDGAFGYFNLTDALFDASVVGLNMWQQLHEGVDLVHLASEGLVDVSLMLNRRSQFLDRASLRLYGPSQLLDRVAWHLDHHFRRLEGGNVFVAHVGRRRRRKVQSGAAGRSFAAGGSRE
jgi:hypothetical protein